jgi:predicted RND superfamily exporter protein
MRKFAEMVLKYRIPIIIGTIIITVFMAFQLRKLEINSDILKYLSQEEPNIVLFNEVSKKFGGNSLAMVAFETDNVFKPETLNRMNIITQHFKGMPEISYVSSLTDIIDIKKMENLKNLANIHSALKDDYLDHYAFIEKIREKTNQEELIRIRKILQEGEDRGIFEINDIELTSFAMISALKGLEYSWTIEVPLHTIESNITKLMDILFNGIVKR